MKVKWRTYLKVLACWDGISLASSNYISPADFFTLLSKVCIVFRFEQEIAERFVSEIGQEELIERFRAEGERCLDALMECESVGRC